MKINVVKSESDFLEFLIEGERHTFPNMLKQKLLENKDVSFVSYVLDHPSSNSARFVLRVKGKSPKKVLEDSVKELEADLDEFALKLKKALK
jgi:DNA-directed RNA polymerase subunit L